VSIIHLWKFYFRLILKKVFIPQVIFFVIFIVYCSYIYKEETHSSEAGQRIVWLHVLFGVAIFVWAVTLIYEEFQQIKT